MAILYIFPLLMGAGGLICLKGKRRGLYCLIASVLFLSFTLLFHGSSVSVIGKAFNEAASVSTEELGGLSAPLGISFIGKLFSTLGIGNNILIIALFTLSAAAIGLYLYRYCGNPAIGATALVSSGFIFVVTEDIPLFIAALLICGGIRYAYEKRFFRFSAFVLLAACFSPSVILLIPMLLLFYGNNLIIKWCLGTALALVLTALPYKKELFSFIYGVGAVNETKLPLYGAVVIIVFALLCSLMRKMIKLRSETAYHAVGFMIFASLMSVPAVFCGGFMPVFICMCMPPLMTLSSEVLPIIGTILEKTFPERKKSAFITGIIISSVAALALFTAALLSGVFTLPVLNLSLF